MNYTHLLKTGRGALLTTLIAAVIGLMSYLALEPMVSRSATDIFTVSQSITGEISYNASSTDVTMDNSIGGVTGGTANGATVAIVTTNNAGGYNMTIQFATGTAMEHESNTDVINNYSPSNPNLPDYTFAIGGAGTPGEMAYSILASTTTDVDPTFLSNGATCGVSTQNNANTCWYNASTTDGIVPIAETIINRTTATEASGSTTTVKFRVEVPANPNPALSTGTYTATATLTAVTN